MHALSHRLREELVHALAEAGREDLVARLEQELDGDEVLTSRQAAKLLGVSSANTVKNWLKGGWFPGAFRTPGGHWRFSRREVEAVRARMAELEARNASGEIAPGDEGGGAPPLL